eukprot:TRINITY_DN298_c0_g2_i1.p1 TRINITY_DN298_c0_g2~~TRINITY_DN298_c0_g2_i1.p1  ORF type:complete len:836 (+),score=293.37 TRINITY_DN298_c0_g2_i1:65-2509(+)
MGCVATSGETEQLLVTSYAGHRSVINGAGIKCIGCLSSSETRPAVLLRNGEYTIVDNDEDGTRRVVNGPTLLYLGALETAGDVQRLPVLRKGQYCKVREQTSGNVRVENGPTVVQLGATDCILEGVKDNPILQDGQYCRVRDEASGSVRVEVGPAVVTFTDHEELLGQIARLPVLQDAEYCKVRNVRTGEITVEHGPALVMLGAHDEVVGGVKRSPLMRKSEYCVVKDLKTGKVRTVVGPCVCRLAAHEETVQQPKELPVLRLGEFVKVKNTENGMIRIEKGPAVVELGPHDQMLGEGVRQLLVLQRGEYCKVVDEHEGSVNCIYGPTVVDLGAHEEVSCDDAPTGVRKCPDLSGDEYLTVRNDSDGTMRNIVGPVMFSPGPFDVFGAPKKVINLSRTEYVRIRNAQGGIVVERGEQRLVPDPLDTVEAGVQQAINVDEHTAVLVRSNNTGKLELVTEHGLFFPEPQQIIVQKQQKIILEPYETVVCKDPSGMFSYASGDPGLPPEERGPGPNFFLPPHHQLLTQKWSIDLKKEGTQTVDVSRFDSRPSYMNYEFTCRTLDNVELVVDVYFFWRIIDVKAMVTSTADPPGDTCTHARSSIMQQISKIKLMDFLERFNEVVRAACLADPFYTERGIELLSAEVLKFECTSSETNQILREIIQETCDRLKRTERQRGENEVSMARLDGEIEEEKKRRELVEVRKSHLRVEARIEGEAEGTRIAAFLHKLSKYDNDEGGGFSMGPERAMEVFELLRRYEADARNSADKRKAVEALGQGTAQLYVLPDDVNLHFGTMQNPMKTQAITNYAGQDAGAAR